MCFANKHSHYAINKISKNYRSMIRENCKIFSDIIVIRGKYSYICASITKDIVCLLSLSPEKNKDKEKVYVIRTIWNIKGLAGLVSQIGTPYLVRGYNKDDIASVYRKLIKYEKNLFKWNVRRVDVRELKFVKFTL